MKDQGDTQPLYPLLEAGIGYGSTTNSKTEKTKVRYYHNDNIGYFARRKRQKMKERYYEALEDLEHTYESDQIVMYGGTQPAPVERKPDRILARISLALNVVLLFTNLAASVMSGSLSIVSTFVDSLMDITSSVIIGVCLWLIHHTNEYNYPRGRNRLELVGVIVCSVIMGFANMALIMQAAAAINSGNIDIDVNFMTLGIIGGGAVIKFGLMLVCYKRNSSSSLVLAMDMRNDIATSIVAVICAYIGSRFWPYADPVGAILVCGLIALSWFHHAIEHIPTLIGKRTERENISRILKIVIEHDHRIKYIDHVMVYHTGPDALVELHIVMDENLPLKITHDISHPLEKKLMRLNFVERAFVHCDYDCDGD